MKANSVHNQKGSSSVLVVLTLLMLVLFGVLGMMSSYSDYKIAQKNASWTMEYYQFEAIANMQLQEIDAAILQKQKEAQVIFDFWKTKKAIPPHVSEIIAGALNSELKTTEDKEQNIELIYSILLKDWLTGYGEAPVVEWSNEEGLLKLLYTTTIELDSGRRYIVQVDLLPQNKEVYQVLMWREIPKTFDYSEGVEFEDVEVIGS